MPKYYRVLVGSKGPSRQHLGKYYNPLITRRPQNDCRSFIVVVGIVAVVGIHVYRNLSID